MVHPLQVCTTYTTSFLISLHGKGAGNVKPRKLIKKQMKKQYSADVMTADSARYVICDIRNRRNKART
jgi:hypothetical protein